MPTESYSRRVFLTTAASLPLLARDSGIPVGLELYSVRDDLKRDLMGTVRAVAKMGYTCVEFFGPYFDWTPAYAKQVRALLDELGVRCFSTHNDLRSFDAEGLPHAVELNQILGSKYVVLASAGNVSGLDGWKHVAERLNQGAEKLGKAGLRAGYHNHQAEWKPVDGEWPMEVLAANTSKDVMLQLDVGTCLEAGADPVAWIERNPGRIRSMHCKDWSAEGGYKVLLGEGAAPWKRLFAAAEKTGGIEFYLVEQEGSAYPAMETAARCLANFRRLHG